MVVIFGADSFNSRVFGIRGMLLMFGMKSADRRPCNLREIGAVVSKNLGKPFTSRIIKSNQVKEEEDETNNTHYMPMLMNF